MNDADSADTARRLEAMGYAPAASPDEADLVVLNTCCVRARPERKVHGMLDKLRALKRHKPGALIAVVGCMAQKEGQAIRRRHRHVDILIGPRQVHRLPELIEARLVTGQPQDALSLSDGAAPAAPIRCAPLRAFVTVMQGCNNFCAYCIVPYVRGREASRPPEEVIEEVARLADLGTREVTLLGQNALAYGRSAFAKPSSPGLRRPEGASPDKDLDGGIGFAELLARVSEIAGIERIRFTTSHPRDLDDRVIAAMADLPKVCEHIHLPMQAGHDRVLAAMRRGYTAAHYEALVARLRGRVPGIAISTDLLVGFPGESDEEFEASVEACRRLRFDQAFMFAYSPREGTTATRLPDQVPEAVRLQRLARLIEEQNRICTEIAQAAVGSQVEILVHGPSDRDPSRLCGRTRQNKLAVFTGAPDLVGRTITACVMAGHLWGFEVEEVAGDR
jgi:tRNA-2-methylthio-N6-dimethylallyladenosine synthase